MNDNFVDEICNCLEKITDAPKIFIRACAYFLVSISQGLKVDPVYFDIRPNIYVLLSSPPGLTRRSTLISRYTIPVFKKAYSTYLADRYGIDVREARKITTNMIIQQGTVEGIVDKISDALENYKLDRFIVSTAEFGGVLLSGKTKDYLIGLFQLLSQLYDGEDFSEDLSRRGKKKSRYLPPGLYVCTLTGMQKPHNYLSKEQFEQGLMRRFIFIYQGAQDKSRWLSLFDTSRTLYREKFFEDIAYELKQRIYNFTAPDRVVIEYKGGDFQKIKEEYDRLERLAETNLAANDESLEAHFRYTCVLQIPKVMMLEALGRYDKPKKKKGNYTIEVTYEDFKRAKDFMNEVYKVSYLEISKLDSYMPKKLEPMPVTGKLEQTLNFIRIAGDDGITDSELLRTTGILKAQLREILTTLAKRKEIVITRLDMPDGAEYRFYVPGAKNIRGKPLSPNVFYNIW